MILWDFLRLTVPAWKKSHDIVILPFCNIVKGQANSTIQLYLYRLVRSDAYIRNYNARDNCSNLPIHSWNMDWPWFEKKLFTIGVNLLEKYDVIQICSYNNHCYFLNHFIFNSFDIIKWARFCYIQTYNTPKKSQIIIIRDSICETKESHSVWYI